MARLCWGRTQRGKRSKQTQFTSTARPRTHGPGPGSDSTIHRKAERGILAYQPGKLLVRGDTPLFKVERLLGVDLDHIEAETLAGLIYDTLKRVPEEEEVLEVEGLRIIIKKMKGPKIVLAKVLLLD